MYEILVVGFGRSLRARVFLDSITRKTECCAHHLPSAHLFNFPLKFTIYVMRKCAKNPRLAKNPRIKKEALVKDKQTDRVNWDSLMLIAYFRLKATSLHFLACTVSLNRARVYWMKNSGDSTEKSVDCLQADSGSGVRAVRERHHDRHLPRPRGPRIHARPQHGGVRTHWPQHEGSYQRDGEHK